MCEKWFCAETVGLFLRKFYNLFISLLSISDLFLYQNYDRFKLFLAKTSYNYIILLFIVVYLDKDEVQYNDVIWFMV